VCFADQLGTDDQRKRKSKAEKQPKRGYKETQQKRGGVDGPLQKERKGEGTPTYEEK